MSKSFTELEAMDWRRTKRESARASLLDAAWRLVRSDGLTGMTLRDLAREAGTTTPTVYAYFASKNAIYDGLFADAAAQFEAEMARRYETPAGTSERLAESANRFVRFCVGDVPRYQLLFQHSIPGFQPSEQAYAPAVRALDHARAQLAECGADLDWHLDLWTALTTGLVTQQMANDPGGDRWSRLVAEAVAMFLSHVRSTNRRPRRT